MWGALRVLGRWFIPRRSLMLRKEKKTSFIVFAKRWTGEQKSMISLILSVILSLKSTTRAHPKFLSESQRSAQVIFAVLIPRDFPAEQFSLARSRWCWWTCDFAKINKKKHSEKSGNYEFANWPANVKASCKTCKNFNFSFFSVVPISLICRLQSLSGV